MHTESALLHKPIAIIFAGIWGFVFWHEIPDLYSILGNSIILMAILGCNPIITSKIKQMIQS
jgi:drug/metabolite transporter (DMT)-like permease